MQLSAERKRLLPYVALGLALFIPVSIKLYLGADIGLGAIVLIVGVVGGLNILRRWVDPPQKWLGALSALTSVAYALGVLVGILITPLSAYRLWFGSFAGGSPEGAVSTLMVLITAFFSSVLSPTMLTMGMAWPLIVIGFVLLYLLAIIIQTQIYLYVVLIALAGALLYVTIRWVAREQRSSAYTFSLALVLVSLIAAGLFPNVEDPIGSDFVNDKVYPRLRKAVVAAVPTFPLLYTVAGYGISFDEKRLGSRPNLLKNPLFNVAGEPGEVLYLRTRVFDTYDGASWEMSPFLSDQEVDSLRYPFFERGRPPVDEGVVTIQLTAKNFGYVPYTLDTERIFFARELPEIDRGSLETGFELNKPLVGDDLLYLQRRGEGDTPSWGTRPEDLSDEERLTYLRIPEDLPNEVRILGDGLSAGLSEKAEILKSIELFLASNYSYDLEVEEMMLEDESDFVYSFLMDATTGFCVQFATSFIILARLNNVPARYATGYLAYIPSDSSIGEVTGLSSHAWPEVWLDGYGWVNWEATPAANIANYASLGENWVFQFGIDLNSRTARQLEGLLGRRVVNESGDEADGSGTVALVARIVLLSLGGILALGILFLGVRFVPAATRYVLRDDQTRFFMRARRVARRTVKLGVPDPRRVGWIEWSRALKARIGSNGQQVDDMREVILRSAYGRNMFDSGYVEMMRRFARYIREKVT